MSKRQKKHNQKSVPQRKADTKASRPAATNGTEKLFTLVLVCFFISGLTGLIYEIIWTKTIVKIIGTAPFAVSIVLTVFMGGLGLGSYIAGRFIDRVTNPLRLLRLYGILEIAIGVYGVLLPLLMILFRPLYAILYNSLFQHFFTYNLLTFAGCAVLLLIPVTCMGATLPILCRFYVTNIAIVGTHVGRLYGLNTIGAAAGSLLCGFWLISVLGVWGTLSFAIVLNLAIGIACLIVAGRAASPEPVSVSTANDSRKSPANNIDENNTPPEERLYVVLALAVLGVSGFCSMSYEVIWTKLLGLIVGPTTYSFTIVLVTFIAGLGLGSIFFGLMADKVKSTVLLLLGTQAVAAVSALLISQVLGNSQVFFAKLIYHFKDHFLLLSLAKGSVLFLVMFLPTFCLGAAFPLVGKIYTRSLAHTGRSIGFAYSINSIGAVLGSFCAGFLFIPLVGKENGVSITVALQLLTLFTAGIFMFRTTQSKTVKFLPVALLVSCGLILAFQYPEWDRKMLSIGKYYRFDKAKIESAGWFESLFSGANLFPDDAARQLVFFGDGISGFTAVLKHPADILGNTGYTLYNSGKADASSDGDMATQTLSAHFPMIFCKEPDNVLVIGLASGITAGEVLCYPVKSLDIVEINKQVVAASDIFIPWNSNVLTRPETSLIVQDARAHIELTRRTYDIISSEPSNPWMAGLASLFTEDFFEKVKGRLNEGGIFVQFIHAYQMDWSTFAMVGRTFSTVFPNSFLVRTNPFSLGPDFLLVGLNSPEPLDLNSAVDNFKYACESRNMKLLNHRLFYNLIISEDLELLFGEGPVNTDNMPILEFAAPRMVHLKDPEIDRMIRSNGLVSDKTQNIVIENFSDIDLRIDFIEYALSLIETNTPLQDMLDLSDATLSQKERFYELMEEYYATNVVSDFSLLTDESLKNRCIAVQIETLRALAITAPDKIPIYFHLGLLCAKNNMVDRAAEYFSEVVELDPDHFNARINLGTALFEQGDPRAAIRHFSGALRIKPDNFQAHYYLGIALFHLAETDYVIDYYSEVSNQGTVKEPKLGHESPDIHQCKENTEKAVEHFREALRINPDSTEAGTDLEKALSDLDKIGMLLDSY